MQELDTNVKDSIVIQQARIEQDPGGPLFKMHNRFIKDSDPAVGLPWDRFVLIIQTLQQHQPNRYTRICQQYPWVSNIT